MIESGWYPPGAEFDPSAPYNEVEVPEKDFDVTCSQSLSKTVTVWTNDYIPGASGVDYEPDDEGGYCACGWNDPDDTSDTDWHKAYSNDHCTPLELIDKFKVVLEEQLKDAETMEDNSANQWKKKKKISDLKWLIDECKNWTDDETEIVEN